MDGTDQYLVTSEQQMFWECCLMWMTMVEVKSATPTHLGPMAADGAWGNSKECHSPPPPVQELGAEL